MTESSEDHSAVINERIRQHEDSVLAGPPSEEPLEETASAAELVALPPVPPRTHSAAPGSLAVPDHAHASAPPPTEAALALHFQFAAAAVLVLVLTLLWIAERRRGKRR